MFNYFAKKKSEDVLRRSSATKFEQASQDVCKRAVGFFPDNPGRNQDLRDTVNLRFHHLLISLEGSERTGCLKITSPYARSRSAILLFRGRVVGCVYGRKYMKGQYLHQDAHKCALSDLASPGNVLDAYELPEDLVLAASSLFYGETLDLNNGQSIEAIFQDAVNSLVRSGMPGCVVVNTYGEETLCIVYVANGRLVGIYSAVEGWMQGTAETVKRLFKGVQCKVHASVMSVSAQNNVGFSLSGLADRLPHKTSAATPYLDFSPPQAPVAPSPPSAIVRTPSREAVAEAVRQHRSAVDAHRSRSYSRV